MKDIVELAQRIVDGVVRIIEIVSAELYNLLAILFVFLSPVLWHGMHWTINRITESSGREVGPGTDFMVFVCFTLTFLFLFVATSFDGKRK